MLSINVAVIRRSGDILCRFVLFYICIRFFSPNFGKFGFELDSLMS